MLDLRPDEKADITLVKVVDAYWKATGHHGWWNGPNALTQPDQDGFQHPLLHFPKFQDHLGESLLNSGFSRNETIAHLQRWGVTSDYVAGEYVHKEELTDTGLMRVVPTTVNILTERYFGAFRRLFGYQLGMWYAPYIIQIIIGARGCGKTDSLSMIALLSEAINPGEDWLHVALIGDQANELYEKAVDYASKQAYLSNGEPCPRTFADTFFWKDGNATIISPYPRIVFEPWDEDDTGRDRSGKSLGGNTIHIRALNDERAAEKRRGKTIGRASADEVLREIEEWSTISKALGDALRGPNEYKLAKLSSAKKQRYVELTHRLRIAEERKNDELAAKISSERASFGVEKSGIIICVGNAGEKEWPWEFQDEYQDNPRSARAWVAQITMYDNPNLTEADRKGYEDRWASDPEGREVELMGKRPVGLGGEIAPALLITARREYDDVTVLHHSGSYGAMHLSRPAKDGWYYMTVGDMGLDRAPRRNAPCIMTWGFDPINGGMELVYFWWYWKRQNTYEQFLKEYRHCIETYPVLDSSYWCYDGGGQQKGTFEVFRSFMQLHPQGNDAPDSIFGYPMVMQNIQKEAAKKMLIQALTNRWVRWPHVEIIERQPSNWNLEMDRKGGAQDVTMCLFMSVIRAWNILNDPSLVREQTDTLPDGFWNPYAAIADPPTGTPLVGTPTGY